MTWRRRGAAFSLTELLVAVALIVVLVGLLLPAIGDAWEAVNLLRCSRNLYMIWTAEASWRSATQTASFTRGPSWITELLPYVENRQDVFECPSAVRGAKVTQMVKTSEFGIDVYSNASFENFIWHMTLDSGWVQEKVIGPDERQYGFEDLGYRGGGDRDYNDIRLTLWFSGGVPTKVRIDGGSSAYHFDLVVNDEVVIHDTIQHVGEEVPLGSECVTTADYGLSTGTYEAGGTTMTGVDPGLFLILDYPKTLADYNEEGTEDEWDKYFVLDADEWTAKYAHGLADQAGGEVTWRHFQSLRHGGRANVLFGDGHVEALGPDDLRQTAPWWRCTAR